MVYDIKRQQVDRLLNVTLALGWELKDEKYDDKGVTVILRRDLPEALLRADIKLETPSSSE
jgi:hypothetical protein